ncbi:DMT family transporter [Balneola sp. MJW-20]|uniref:DMT family transporter n=1 Tax=Gracilimonas aurantiaca TaxID=3234185 RepID=UPI003467E909
MTDHSNTSALKIYGSLAVGLTAFGFAPVLVKLVSEYSPLLVAALRTVIAFLLLVPFYLRTDRSEMIEDASKKDHKWVMMSGIALGIHFNFWIGSIYYTSVASASVLVVTHPIILIIAERFLYKTQFQLTAWAGVLIAFGGSVLLGYADHSSTASYPDATLGNLMALSAAAIFAFYFLIGRKVRQNRNWLGYVVPVYGYAALTCVVILLVFEGIAFEWGIRPLLIGLALALGPQIMGHGSLNYAVKYVSPTLLSTLILAEPVLATLLAFSLFSEWPSSLSMLAMLVILSGIALTWRKRKRRG